MYFYANTGYSKIDINKLRVQSTDKAQKFFLGCEDSNPLSKVQVELVDNPGTYLLIADRKLCSEVYLLECQSDIDALLDHGLPFMVTLGHKPAYDRHVYEIELHDAMPCDQVKSLAEFLLNDPLTKYIEVRENYSKHKEYLNET